MTMHHSGVTEEVGQEGPDRACVELCCVAFGTCIQNLGGKCALVAGASCSRSITQSLAQWLNHSCGLCTVRCVSMGYLLPLCM